MKPSIYWIRGPWPGRLAILARPRGGDWLEDEVAAWRDAGIDVVVSALTEDEADEFELGKERELVRSSQLEYHEFPISDRGVPSSVKKMEDLSRALEGNLTQGKNVGVHCRQSIGRSSLIAASVLVLGGVDLNQAFERLASARGCPVPETAGQKEWLIKFAKGVAAATHTSR